MDRGPWGDETRASHLKLSVVSNGRVVVLAREDLRQRNSACAMDRGREMGARVTEIGVRDLHGVVPPFPSPPLPQLADVAIGKSDTPPPPALPVHDHTDHRVFPDADYARARAAKLIHQRGEIQYPGGC
jgi:hypothetical protein